MRVRDQRKHSHPVPRPLPASAAGVLLLLAAPTLFAQGVTVEARPGAQYAASGLQELLLGSGYRDLWTTPARIPVLDLRSFAGGLTPVERGGGRQTRTLHLQGADGRRYVFRSVDKYVEQVLPEDLQGTLFENLLQDQISAFHPGGALALPPLLERAAVLHVRPQLVVMPDDERLGEHRGGFAGMIGLLEERPSEGPDDTPGFAGSARVEGTEDMVEELREDGARVAGREYLAARLIDFLVGDTDRGPDQWRWARVDGPDGVQLWRPIPRDRDWAFLRTTGVVPGLARLMLPKQVTFGPRLPGLRSLTVSSIRQDRQFLSEVPRSAFDSTASALWHGLDEGGLAAAVGSLLPEHRQLWGSQLLRSLRARREALPSLAARFYRELSREVDVAGTDTTDLAVIEHSPDGSVEVSLAVAGEQRDSAGALRLRSPYFSRTFVPEETREVRVYLHGGEDRAVVRGSGSEGIRVHVIGGKGDDLLADSSRSTDVRFHDHEGENRFIEAANTRVHRRSFEPPRDSATWINVATGTGRYRDWGATRSIGPVADYVEGAGLVIGAGFKATRYGFRRVPAAARASLEVQYSAGNGSFGVEAGVERPWFAAPVAFTATARALQFEPLRFAGLGNDTPPPPGRKRGLLLQDHAAATVGWRYAPSADTRLSAGVRAVYTDPRAPEKSLLAESGTPGAEPWSAGGVWLEGQLAAVRGGAQPRRGVALLAGAELYPLVGDLPGSFGGAEAELRGYVTAGPTLALRVGGRKAWGSAPVQEAALLGGRRSLRGYPFQRFAGDASVYGGAELRAPLARVHLLTRGELGALVLADAGRVFVDGESPGGWHTAWGGGLTFTTMDVTVSATYARGEAGHLYLGFGFPF